jgi:hypothetical protein
MQTPSWATGPSGADSMTKMKRRDASDDFDVLSEDAAPCGGPGTEKARTDA